jgi:hypothetical protein
MQKHTAGVALCSVFMFTLCQLSAGQHAAKRSPPVALGRQQQQQQQAQAWPPSSTKPFTKLATPTASNNQSLSISTAQQEQAQLYECVMCSKPAAGVVRAAAASASAQQTVVAALQAAGIQVKRALFTTFSECMH